MTTCQPMMSSDQGSLLVIVALPAVLSLSLVAGAAGVLVLETQGTVVGDGGAARRAGVEESQGAVVGDVWRCRRCWSRRKSRRSLLVMIGTAGRAGVEEIQAHRCRLA